MEIISKICINMFGGYILLLYICYIKIRYTNNQTLLILYIIIMNTVFILSGINGTFDIVECYPSKNGSYTHNEGVILGGFENKDQADMYCDEFNYIIKN